MPAKPLHSVIRQIRHIVGQSASVQVTDRQLLACFARLRDEVAFAELVQRHERLVRRVCWRVLGHSPDADDAFQATFLVLARKAGSVRWRDSVHGWLYKVAHHMAKKLKRAATRRRASEAKAGQRLSAPQLQDAGVRELAEVLEEELHRLAARYRDPLLLCYVEGLTRDQAARRLGLALRTLDRRLAQGRSILRARLERRGIALSTALVAFGLREATVSAKTTATLTAATVRMAVAFAAGSVATGPTGPAAQLANGLIKSMTAAKIKLVAAVLVGIGMAAAGGLLGRGPYAEQKSASPDGVSPPAPQPLPGSPETREGIHVDQYGDPLPTGVLASMGSRRMRAGRNLRALAYSPAGRALAGVTENGVIWIWDKEPGRVLRRFRANQSEDFQSNPADVAFATESTLAWLTSRPSARFRLLDIATGRELFQIELPGTSEAREVAISPGAKRLAVAREDGTVQLVEANTGKEMCRLPAKGPHLFNLAFCPSGDRVAVAEGGETLRIYHAASGRIIKELKQKGGNFEGVTFSGDGRSVATISRFTEDTSTISLWDMERATERARLRGTEGYSCSIAFSPDGKWLAGSSQQSDVVLWNAATGAEVRRFRTWHFGVRIAFSRDSSVLAVGTVYGEVTQWNVATGQRLAASADPPVWNSALCFSPDGRQVLGCSNSVRSWDVASGQERSRSAAAWGFVARPQFSPDGALVAIDQKDKTISLRDARTGKEKHRLESAHGLVLAMAFTEDGRRLFAGGPEKSISVWDVASGRLVGELKGHGLRQGALAVSQDGRWLAAADVGTPDYAPHLFELSTGRIVRRVEIRGGGYAHALAFSPDSRRLACVTLLRGDGPTYIQIWDIATGKEWRLLTEANHVMTCLAFSPDGRTLATYSTDRTRHMVRLWELASGRPRRTLVGHEGQIFTLCYSPDGRRLAASSADAPLYVWDVTDGSAVSAPPTRKEAEKLWTELASHDAEAAYATVWKLASGAPDGVSFLKQRLRPIASVDRGRLGRLIADLERPEFELRRRALQELEQLGPLAASAISMALERTPSVDLRRSAGELLDKLDADALTPDLLRQVRAIEALEYAATSAAIELLKDLATGAPEARLTVEAKGSLERLGKRTALGR